MQRFTTPDGSGPRSGMSLVEVTICSAILLSATLAGASVQLGANRVQAEARETTLAVGVLEDAMDRVQEIRLAEFWAGDAPVALGEELPVAAPGLRDLRVTLDAPAWSPGDEPALLEVVLRLEFVSSSGQPRQMAMAGLLR